MTIAEIETKPLKLVAAFAEVFIRLADANDAHHSNLLHAISLRFTREKLAQYIKAQLS